MSSLHIIDRPTVGTEGGPEGKQESSLFPDLETQYRTLFAMMAEGAMLQGADGRVLAINPAAEGILGCSAGALAEGTSAFSGQILREDGNPFPVERQPWTVALRTGRPQEKVAMGIRRGDGTLSWVVANTQPLFAHGQSTCHGVLTVFQDFTRQRLAEEELRQDEEGLQSLFEAVPNPFFIKDRDGRYLGCNSAFDAYLGLSRDQIIGRTVYDIAPKELADRYFAADQELFDHPGTQVYEARVRWADGSLRDVILHKSPLFGAGGEIRGLTGIIVDITERKRMEQALRQREQQYRTLVEHSPDLIVRYDTGLRRIYVNPAWERASGLAAEEVIDIPPTETPKVPQPVSKVYLQALQQALESGTRQSVEFSWVNAHGKTLFLQHAVVPETDQNGEVVSLLSVGHDITGFKHAEEALRNSESHLRRVNRALLTLSAGNETLVRAGSEQELLEQMCGVMVDVGGHVLASIGQVSQDGLSIEPRAWAGVDGASLRKCVSTGRCSPLAAALEQGRAVVVHDITDDPLCCECEARSQAGDIRSGMVLPLCSEGETLGTFSIYSSSPSAFDDDEIALLTELGNDLAYGIRSLRTRLGREEGLRHIQETMEATIQALANTLEFRDPYTAGHQRRVAQLAREIARDLGLEEDRIRGLYLASVVHDIGKVRVPAEVLIRPGRLSQLEFDIVMTHVEAGYDILKAIDFPWPIAQIVRQHHERMDGSGYPLGVGSEALLLEARILSVADVVEAISSFRPYRPALGIERGLQEIEAGRDRLFDSEVVDACIRVIREKGFVFE